MTEPQRPATSWGRGVLKLLVAVVVTIIVLWVLITLFFAFIFPTPN
jgi:hypothetical protein